MANKNGHWYTDKNGNHYFVENGQSPKEGWEASKRRKMIDGGEYKVSEDGNEYKSVSRDEYDKFEADDDFDINNEDDFGFDEDDAHMQDQLENESDKNIQRFNELNDAIEGADYDRMENELQYEVQDAYENGEISKDQYNELFDKMEKVMLDEPEAESGDDDLQGVANELVERNYFKQGEIKDIRYSEDGESLEITTDEGTKQYDYVGGRLYNHKSNDSDTEDDNLDLNDRKTRETLVNDYEEHNKQNSKPSIDYDERIKNSRQRYLEKTKDKPFGEQLDKERYSKAQKIAEENGWYNPNHFTYIDGVSAYEEGEFNDDDLKNYFTEKYGKSSKSNKFDADLNNWQETKNDLTGTRKIKSGNKEIVINKDGYIYTFKDGKPFPDGHNTRYKSIDEAKNALSNEPYQSKYKSEDFEDARYYPVSDEDRKAAGPRYLGRYHSIYDAHGLDDKDPAAWKKERDMFKYVGDSDTGASIVQGPDGYFSGNPRINSMSFKTFEQAKDYLDRKNPDEHKYGIYFKPGDEREYMYRDKDDKYDLEAPDAYRNARESAKNKPLQERPGYRKVNKETMVDALVRKLPIPGDVIEEIVDNLDANSFQKLEEWLFNTKVMKN